MSQTSVCDTCEHPYERHTVDLDDGCEDCDCSAFFVAPASADDPQYEDERHYFDALDEVYALRALLAHEALVLKAHLGYKTFPKSRRAIAEEQVERMQQAARGQVKQDYTGSEQRKHALTEAGAPEILTRGQWEDNRGRAD